MIRVKGTLSAKKTVELTQKKLDKFGLSIQNHIFEQDNYTKRKKMKKIKKKKKKE